jgi:hypothetical protein
MVKDENEFESGALSHSFLTKTFHSRFQQNLAQMSVILNERKGTE